MNKIKTWHIRQGSIDISLKEKPEIELAADELCYIMNSKHLHPEQESSIIHHLQCTITHSLALSNTN